MGQMGHGLQNVTRCQRWGDSSRGAVALPPQFVFGILTATLAKMPEI